MRLISHLRVRPSPTRIILSILGGIIGIIVSATVLLFGITGALDEYQPSQGPIPTMSEQPTDEPPASDGDDDGGERPSPEAIGAGIEKLHHEGGVTTHDGVPGFYPCVGEHFYNSEMSDETLRTIASGKDLTGPVVRETAVEIGTEATLACDPKL